MDHVHIDAWIGLSGLFEKNKDPRHGLRWLHNMHLKSPWQPKAATKASGSCTDCNMSTWISDFIVTWDGSTDPNLDSSGIAGHNGPSRWSNPESEPFLILSLNHCSEPQLGSRFGGRVCVWFSSRLVHTIPHTCSVFLPFPPLHHIVFLCSGACHGMGPSHGVGMGEMWPSLSGEPTSPLTISQHGSPQWMASDTDAGRERLVFP